MCMCQSFVYGATELLLFSLLLMMLLFVVDSPRLRFAVGLPLQMQRFATSQVSKCLRDLAEASWARDLR